MKISNISLQYITHTFSYGLNYLQFNTQYSGGSGIVSEIFQPVSWEEY